MANINYSEYIRNQAINLLTSNIIDPNDNSSSLNWVEREGPWGRKIQNYLVPSKAQKYITPSKSTFVGQWYWDSMGIIVGLVKSNNDELKRTAISMVRNLFYLYDRLKLIPNAADSAHETRSQPPLLSSMCREVTDLIYSNKHDNSVNLLDWLKLSYTYCKKEVELPWMKNSNELGFRYFDNIGKQFPGVDENEILALFRPESRSDGRIIKSLVYKIKNRNFEEIEFFGSEEKIQFITETISKIPDKQRVELRNWLMSRRLLVCSGMDFTASYGIRKLSPVITNLIEPKILKNSDLVNSCIDQVSPVDLNCLLYKYYIDLDYFANELIKLSKTHEQKSYYLKEKQKWETNIQQLKQLIYKYHYSKDKGIFLNYNYKENSHLDKNIHITTYSFPLWVKIVEDKDAFMLVEKIRELITPYGIQSTNDKTGYQWDFNMWPLQTWITVKGLLNYGYKEDAMKITKGYIKCVEKVFESNHSFYEKYNAQDGSIATDGRYGSVPSFSWSAAVYIALIDLMEQLK